MLTYILPSYDFGYTWPWTHGHLALAAVLAAASFLIRRRWWRITFICLTLWALSAFLVNQYVVGYNAPQAMPTANFLVGGTGRVLDLGAGSGRTSLMVALARPKAHVVALDNFSAQYIKHNGPELLLSNARAAGVAERIEVLTADMRQIPVQDAGFDAVVSSYAIDHLNRAGIEQTMRETNRVLKPGGEFLLIIIRKDFYLSWLYGPLVFHGAAGPAFWQRQLENAGFAIVEQGLAPGTAWWLSRSRWVERN